MATTPTGTRARRTIIAALVMAGVLATPVMALPGSGWSGAASPPVPSRGAITVVAAGHDGFNYDRSRGLVFGNATTGTKSTAVGAANAGSLAGKSISAIEADGINQCAIASDGSLHCWGGYMSPTGRQYDLFQLGAGVESKEPRQIFGSGVTAVDVSEDFSCAIVDGQAKCWGDTRAVTGSNSELPPTTAPTTPTGLPAVSAIAADDGKACAIDLTGAVWCWGAMGQELGVGADSSSPRPPTKLAGSLVGKVAVQVSAGADVGCALDANGGLHCWGSDGAYVGSGTSGRVLVPVQIGGSLAGRHVVQVSVSDKTHFALDSQGLLHSWGFNDTPSRVTRLGSLAGKQIIQIRADEGHRCAIDSAGSAHCWGDNGYGQLGLGSTSAADVPKVVSKGGVAGKVVVSVSVADEITYFLVSGRAMSFPSNAKDSGSVTLNLSGLSQSLSSAGATLSVAGKASSKAGKYVFPIVRASTKHMLLDGSLEVTSASGSKIVLAAPIVDVSAKTISVVVLGGSTPYNGNRLTLLSVNSKLAKPKVVIKKAGKKVTTTRTTTKLAVTVATSFPGDALVPTGAWMSQAAWAVGTPAGDFSSNWRAVTTSK